MALAMPPRRTGIIDPCSGTKQRDDAEQVVLDEARGHPRVFATAPYQSTDLP
jgi:hypothetical protein